MMSEGRVAQISRARAGLGRMGFAESLPKLCLDDAEKRFRWKSPLAKRRLKSVMNTTQTTQFHCLVWL